MGEYKARCDICGARYLRSEMRRMRDGTLRCPDDSSGLDQVSLAEIEAENAANLAMRINRYPAPVGAVGQMPTGPSAQIGVNPWVHVEAISGLVEHFAPYTQVVEQGRVVSWGTAFAPELGRRPYRNGVNYREHEFLITQHSPNQTSGSIAARFRNVKGFTAFPLILSAEESGTSYCSLAASYAPFNEVNGKFGTDNDITISKSGYPFGGWYTTALAWTTTTVTLYAEQGGTSEVGYSGTRHGNPTTRRFFIGGRNDGTVTDTSDLMTGNIKAAAIFERAITQDDFDALVEAWT
jgi:hypothetical protein